MKSLDLTGQWNFRQQGQDEQLDATVPGCVHTDLLTAGKIPDPFVEDNELACRWVGDREWIYSRRFEVPADFKDHQRVELHCEGLDTLATVKLNGQVLGEADNMFRTWCWDAGELLQVGTNTIEVTFHPVGPYARQRQEQRPIGQWGADEHKIFGGNWLRKMQCNFGWDWGPSLVTCGIWRRISLVAFSRGRLSDVSITQDHSEWPAVKLGLDVASELLGADNVGLRARVTGPDGQTTAEVEASDAGTETSMELEIPNARLWWPAGMGDQPLYDVQVTLLDEAGQELDRLTRRTGLRTLNVRREEDQWGESFAFRVNGRDFFAKGANWIPADAFVSRIPRAQYERLLADAAEANMNMLRVWGGGIYEADEFYDICDELGLCVWQDFMFACATYPTFDADWMANCRAEFEDNIRRLRHHPCVALWCGNNELEMGLVDDEWSERKMSWADYDKLFEKMLPEVVEQLDSQRDYWPCSPHNSRWDRKGGNADNGGDAHVWAVWHGRQPFEFYRTCDHRFLSEFGFQSFPEPRTVEGYTREHQRNVTSYVMEHHQRSRIGNTCIMTYMLDWFRMPVGFEQTLWLSQILQGLAISIGVEHWRRNQPRTMGALYWQLNDCWPVASWASIDYHGRWKALQHMARRFFAPVLLSAVEQDDPTKVDLHVTSDQAEDRPCELRRRILDLSGAEIAGQRSSLSIPAGSTGKVAEVDLTEAIDQRGKRQVLLAAELVMDDEVVSRQIYTPARPKHLELAPAEFDVRTTRNGDGLDVTVATDVPALYVWLDTAGLDVRLSDNFFHLIPGHERTIRIQPAGEATVADIEEALKIRDLRWTYAGA